MSQAGEGSDLPPPLVNGGNDAAVTMASLAAGAVNATLNCDDDEGILVWGIVAIGIFYLVVLLVGCLSTCW